VIGIDHSSSRYEDLLTTVRLSPWLRGYQTCRLAVLKNSELKAGKKFHVAVPVKIISGIT